MLLLFGGCTAALIAGPAGDSATPSATPATTVTRTTTVTVTPTPAATPSPARHRRHTPHATPSHPRPTRTHTRHVVTHRPKPTPRPTHTASHPHRLVVTPGAFCAHDQAGDVGVSTAGRTYVCRTDAAGRLRWRRP